MPIFCIKIALFLHFCRFFVNFLLFFHTIFLSPFTPFTQKTFLPYTATRKFSMSQQLLMTIAFAAPFLATTLGCTFIYLFKSFSPTLNSITLSLSSGIMLSASIFSLLMPAIDNAKEDQTQHFIIPIIVGLLVGILIMITTNLITSKIHSKNNKLISLFSAITLHNIPEGLIVGFAVGSAISTNSLSFSSIAVAVGIALQNIPEGLATALSIYSCTKNKTKSFLLGTLSGIAEPIFAVLGFFLTSHITLLLPWLLAFSAGTMLFVVFEELLPDSHQSKLSMLDTCCFLIGFMTMMCLDLCL